MVKQLPDVCVCVCFQYASLQPRCCALHSKVRYATVSSHSEKVNAATPVHAEENQYRKPFMFASECLLHRPWVNKALRVVILFGMKDVRVLMVNSLICLCFPLQTFDKILIANRGEIACRVSHVVEMKCIPAAVPHNTSYIFPTVQRVNKS